MSRKGILRSDLDSAGSSSVKSEAALDHAAHYSQRLGDHLGRLERGWPLLLPKSRNRPLRLAANLNTWNLFSPKPSDNHHDNEQSGIE